MLAPVKSGSSKLFTGKETIVLRSLPAVVVLYFTVSEKENLRRERKQNYSIKNEKKKTNETSDYYYLSKRKRIEVLFSSRVTLLAFYLRESFKRTSLFTRMR